nr:MAG TPA: hypothetical protein [Caudoviricetes sp.]
MRGTHASGSASASLQSVLIINANNSTLDFICQDNTRKNF